ncbi:Ammonium/H(+) antiporter subunit AmhT [Lentibacillus sp. JNUCC-1]|uniref:cation:proton antiporter n=1 Tax=Lentibacillus sp. JNUCC-1 TaxID=2654513 RepID=UPI0012E95ECF|nr:cation:proton antiporter [Lentibacillus sp. JNUCC-1]MUV39231.1 Ammonium/H(+) antiporter subunit AmhT [Lentibacillus sp. JNUCC-1]
MLDNLPILLDAGLILIGIFLLGFFALKVKIPSVVFYILFGISLTGLLDHNQLLHFSSEVAIVLLFFLLGLEFSTKRLGDIAKKIWHAGLLDVVLSFGITMLIAILFGMDLMTAFLIGGITYATSSSITAKLLDDKGRMANTETEFMLGLLIFEDLVAPVAVAVMIALSTGEAFTTGALLILVGKIVGLALVAIVLGKTLFLHFEEFLEKLEEEDIKIALLVGIAISYGGLATYLGLSDVLGAFLAGVMLAEIGKVELIKGIVTPVRDLLLPTFFVYFGTTISLGAGVPMPVLLVVLLIWSIVAKVLVGMIGGKWYGLSPRVSFRAGLSFCARGEFSVVIASIAVGAIKVFSGVYIVLAAFLGMILFNMAPAITTKVYGKPVKKKQGIKVPGS